MNMRGIYAASITPFDDSGKPDHDQLTAHLLHLEKRGCHGVLLAGTTGEGPSLSVEERIGLFKAAVRAETHLVLLAGTGAASLEDTVILTQTAFDNGLAGVVIIPPFFFRQVNDDGLVEFYVEVIRRAVPADGRVLLYHNPVASSVGISMGVVHTLRDQFPTQVVGIKDSSADWSHTEALLTEFPDFLVLVGDDSLLADSLRAGGGGAITGMANLFPELLVDTFGLHSEGQFSGELQRRIVQTAHQLDGLPRIAAIKRLLAAGRIIENVEVRPPLTSLSGEHLALLSERFHLSVTAPQVIDLGEITREPID